MSLKTVNGKLKLTLLIIVAFGVREAHPIPYNVKLGFSRLTIKNGTGGHDQEWDLQVLWTGNNYTCLTGCRYRASERLYDLSICNFSSFR